MRSTPSIATIFCLPVLRGGLGCALLALYCLSATGCSVIEDTHHVLFLAKRTTKLEPQHFPYIRNEKMTRRRDAQLAKRVWAEVASQSGAAGFTKHYERGFVTGFADYMYRGGDGEAPLVPPRDYWQLGYQSDRGKQAVDEWYEGFRHGVQECRARGYREMVVVRSSLLSSSNASYETSIDETPLLIESEVFEPTPAEPLPAPEPDAAEPLPVQDDDHAWAPVRPDSSGVRTGVTPRRIARQLRPAGGRPSARAVDNVIRSKRTHDTANPSQTIGQVDRRVDTSARRVRTPVRDVLSALGMCVLDQPGGQRDSRAALARRVAGGIEGSVGTTAAHRVTAQASREATRSGRATCWGSTSKACWAKRASCRRSISRRRAPSRRRWAIRCRCATTEPCRCR